MAATGTSRAFPAGARGGVLGLVLFGLGPAQYLLFEAVSAAAWSNPGYSYYTNPISDLGVVDGPLTHQGREIDSPLGLLMNAGFVLLGVLGTTGILLLARHLPRSTHRRCVRFAGVGFGLGAVLVGLFPENGVESAHVAGAVLNIGSGIALVGLLGAGGERFYGLPRWQARLLLGLAVAAGVTAVAMVTVPGLFLGVVERLAVYTYTLSFIALATAGLYRTRAHQPFDT